MEIIWPPSNTRAVIQRSGTEVTLTVIDPAGTEILFAVAPASNAEVLYPPDAPVPTLRVGGAFVRLTDELAAVAESVLTQGWLH